MPIKNAQGQEKWTEEEIAAAIAKMEALERLDPPFPYTIMTFDPAEFGVNDKGVDIPFFDTK